MGDGDHPSIRRVRSAGCGGRRRRRERRLVHAARAVRADWPRGRLRRQSRGPGTSGSIGRRQVSRPRRSPRRRLEAAAAVTSPFTGRRAPWQLYDQKDFLGIRRHARGADCSSDHAGRVHRRSPPADRPVDPGGITLPAFADERLERPAMIGRSATRSAMSVAQRWPSMRRYRDASRAVRPAIRRRRRDGCAAVFEAVAMPRDTEAEAGLAEAVDGNFTNAP